MPYDPNAALPAGIGNDAQAQQATWFMRNQPWYQEQLKKWGVTPQGDAYGNVRLNDDQQGQLRDLITSKGIGLNHKYDGIDENGNIVEEHHKLRNGLIAAAIAGLGATGLGAAGIGPLSGLFGAGAGAAGAAGGVGAGTGFGAAGAGIGGVGAGTAATAGGAGSVLAGLGGAAAASSPLLNMGMNLESSPTAGLNSPMGLPSSVPTGSNLAGGAATGGGSTINKIMNAFSGKGGGLSDLSSLFGSTEQGIKNNRSLEGIFSQNYDKNAVDAQTAAIAARDAATRQLAQSKYILSGGFQPKTNSIQLNGQTRALPDFGFGPTPSSEAQKQGAGDLQASALKTLAPGGTYTPQPLSNYATPGTGEKLAGVGSTVTSFLPYAKNIWDIFRK